jgi:hypothetical protein
MCVQEEDRLKHEKLDVFTWLFMLKERPREASMLKNSRRRTKCQSSKMVRRILVSSAGKKGI